MYSMNSGRGLVEVRFSGNGLLRSEGPDAPRTVDNQAAAFVKLILTAVTTSLGKFSKGLFGTVGLGLAKVELSSYSGTIRILKARLVCAFQNCEFTS